MAIKLNGEVPFPQAGEGLFLCFTLRDIAKLEDIYGIGEYYGTIETNLRQGSGGTVMRCLEIGLKMRSPEGKRIQAKYDPDAMSFPASEAFMPIMDALSLGAAGLTYAEMLEQAAKAEEMLKEAIQSAAPKEEAESPLPDSEAQSVMKL
jgi:hypothetical protein